MQVQGSEVNDNDRLFQVKLLQPVKSKAPIFSFNVNYSKEVRTFDLNDMVFTITCTHTETPVHF